MKFTFVLDIYTAVILHKYSSSLGVEKDVADICSSKIFTVSENTTVKMDHKVHYNIA